MLKKIFFLLFLGYGSSYSQIQIGANINGEVAYDFSGYNVSLSFDGNVLAVGAPYNDTNGTDSGQVKVYRNFSGNWIQVGNVINGEAANDLSGFTVSLSGDGNILAIGSVQSFGNDGLFPGYVTLYENVLGSWIQLGNRINGEENISFIGYGISLSSDGTTIAIGTNNNNASVSVYKNMAGIWTQIGTNIVGEGFDDIGNYSLSLAANGTVVAIGSPYSDANGIYSGNTRIYENVSGTWTQVGNEIEGENAGDNSGFSVSLASDGTIVAIGAVNNAGLGESRGQVRIYQNVSGNWIQVGNEINGEGNSDGCGYVVSLSSDGSIIAIAAPSNSDNGIASGHVRIYRNISGTWMQIGNDINGENVNDVSGFSASLSGDGTKVAIGAPFNDGNGIDSGHVRVFDLGTVLSSDIFFKNNLLIYPNPSNKIVNISLGNNLQLEKVTIYNTLGQMLKTTNSLQLDVTDLAKGSYYIEVVSNKWIDTKTIFVN